jgi:uroporphyrinogen-III synthase
VNEYLIFTSQNAVQQFLNYPEQTNFSTRKCFCVGDKTAQLLKNNHFEIVEKSDNAKSLADLICEKHKSNAFTFFSGVARLDTLPELLTQNEIRWNEIQVYETVLNPHQMNIEADGVLFFSPSGVESFLIKNPIGEAQCFCIGNTTAQKLANFTKNIIIANQPTIENVLIQTINYFKNDPPITQI